MSKSTRRVRQGDRFLKIQPGGSLAYSSRNKRELEVVRDLGMEPLVLVKGDEGNRSIVEGWECIPMTTRPLGHAGAAVYFNRFVSLLTWAKRTRDLRPAVISGHDLIGATIGWLSMLGMPKSKRPHLVYDSHEFELGRHTIPRRSRVELALTRRLERFLITRSSFSIMVNDSIADLVQELHGTIKKPVVVRSTPAEWFHTDEAKTQRRTELLNQLGLGSETFLMMYHGVVRENRGIEIAIRALSGRENAALAVLGNGADRYLEELKRLASEQGVEERVLFHPAVPFPVLGEYVGAADVGMVTVPAVVESYYLMLPNKLFENIQAETPVVASNFPEVRSVVEEFDVGLLVDPLSLNEVNEALDKIQKEPGLRQEKKQNAAVAKSVLCWERERKHLVNAYREIMR